MMIKKKNKWKKKSRKYIVDVCVCVFFEVFFLFPSVFLSLTLFCSLARSHSVLLYRELASLFVGRRCKSFSAAICVHRCFLCIGASFRLLVRLIVSSYLSLLLSHVSVLFVCVCIFLCMIRCDCVCVQFRKNIYILLLYRHLE